MSRFLKISSTVMMLIMMGETAIAQMSDFTVSGNISGISDYRFRGVSLTSKDPAVQGTLNLQHSSGFYVTVWGSNISDFNGANTEVDVMAGYVFDAGNDVSFNLGVMEYIYPGGTGTNYFEAYGFATFPVAVGSLTVGINYTPSQNNIGSQDNTYLSASYSMPILDTGLTGSAYFAYEDGAFGTNKTDWSLGLSYDIDQITIGAKYIDTNLGSGAGSATGLGYITLNF
ncbi:TorF family putative porin [Pseudemcibacter aquimaris]|uniref:TorF family putative porin n=1 Tax=Pseudemcibacter aquimaris TaxID=2857064 RepID=UPI00201314D3|nr:TorF family putative porin [Pseudemcibacter aquimaris]MCC3860559.1 TorF family putative porin [Pseudemcibacter aquimaris]WDU59382.1 TorF family putative porin [Pseudemcibacter aquimaris]